MSEEKDTTAPPAAAAAASSTSEAAATDSSVDLAKQNEQTVEQQNAINATIKATQPKVGAKEEVDALLPEYEGNPKPGFRKGVQDLGKRYSALRRVRGDGNCFYRSFLFGYLERLLQGIKSVGDANTKAMMELSRLRQVVHDSKAALIALGYEEVALDDFWQTFLQELDALPNMEMGQLEINFREEAGPCEYIVWYCRMLTSGFLKLNADRFLPFLEHTVDMQDFCQREVEPMGKECEQIQIMGLCEHLNTPVKIEYLDGQDFSGQLGSITLPDTGAEAMVTLLYRPGHYDVLYPMTNQ
ncbi:unnamed protein product [Ectocarpus sp. 6 AP-2014]